MIKPELLFVTGPNAAGKSSFIRTHLSELPDYEIIMSDVYKARTWQVFEQNIKNRTSIAFESVFNDEKVKELIDLAKQSGYNTTLVALFLNSPQQSLERSFSRKVNEGGLPISKDTVLLNFNENFKNLANYYFYFDRSDFVFTGIEGENLNIMTFHGQVLTRYQSNDLTYIQAFADVSLQKGRLDKDAYDIIKANKDFTKHLTNDQQDSRKFGI